VNVSELGSRAQAILTRNGFQIGNLLCPEPYVFQLRRSPEHPWLHGRLMYENAMTGKVPLGGSVEVDLMVEAKFLDEDHSEPAVRLTALSNAAIRACSKGSVLLF
jgi:hypothetical protein